MTNHQGTQIPITGLLATPAMTNAGLCGPAETKQET
jgi:hypothetical protein